ncbi:MAG: hypothetical protein ACYC3I_17185 [Gemmataceae bacterium]
MEQWLAEINLSAAEALTAGLTPPAELRLRWTALTDFITAKDDAAEYRRERGFVLSGRL